MPVSVHTLSSVALKAIGLKPVTLMDPLTADSSSPITMLIAMIYYLPLAVRKFLLDACRIQAPVSQNATLQASLYTLPGTINAIIDDHCVRIILIEDICTLLDCVTPYPILCSLLSYFVRAEATIHVAEFLEEKMKSFDKEVGAALAPDQDQCLDYTSLYGIGDNPIHPQQATFGFHGPRRLTTLWASGIQRIKSTLSNSRTPPIFPAYSNLRNVGRETVDNYLVSVYGPVYDPKPEDYRSTTTLTLLRHYFQTGEKILGPLELRQAWFFNDLKPRTYYCLGGSAFWDGLYIQQIANMFATILPSTAPNTRFDVSRLGPSSPDYYVFTYDYSSFTTSLAELKFFLFWLAESLRGCPVLVLDVVHGIRRLDLGEVIHSYNQAVNVYQVFSTERFFPLLSRYIRQGRSGSLGVKGNIVWSMINHGVSLAGITSTPDRDSCVGDDALGKILIHLMELLIICVNNLGSINPAKFSFLRPSEDVVQGTLQQYKYLKRPLGLDLEGRPTLGILDFFPDIAGTLFEGDGIHSVRDPDRTPLQKAKTFAQQWGRFLRIQRESLDYTSDLQMIREEDLEVLLGAIAACYRKLGLPLEGGVPGSYTVPTDDGRQALEIMCPPCEFVVFESPWEEVLVDRFRGHIISEPIWMGGMMPPPVDLEAGDRFRSTSSKLMTLLEDLGCVTRVVCLQDVVFDEEYLVAYRERLLHGKGSEETSMLCEFTVLHVPFWYLDLSLYYHPETIPMDPMDARSRVTSLSVG